MSGRPEAALPFLDNHHAAPIQAICGQADILRLQPVVPSTLRDGGNGRTRCRLEPRPDQVAGVSPRPSRRALAVVPHRRAGRGPRAVPSQAYASGTRLWRPEELTDPGRLPLARTLPGDGQTGIDHRWGLAVSRRARHHGEATGPALGASTTTAGRVPARASLCSRRPPTASTANPPPAPLPVDGSHVNTLVRR